MSERPRVSLDNSVFRGRLVQTPIRTGAAIRGTPRQTFGPRIEPQQPAQPVPQHPTQPLAQSPVNIQVSPSTDPAPAEVPLRVVQPQPVEPKMQQSTVLRRQSVTPPANDSQPLQSPPPLPYVSVPTQSLPPSLRSKRKIALAGLAGIVLLTTLLVGFLLSQGKKSEENQGMALAGNSANVSSAETKPTADAVSSYSVEPESPKFITIPKLYVFARVKPINIDANNEMQAPENIHDAGWFSSSAKPGSAPVNGAMVINGNVQGPTQPGIFANLKQLVAGDVIKVTKGNGEVISYTVVRTQSDDPTVTDISPALITATPRQHGLNLVSYGSEAAKISGKYTERTIVFAIKS